jgi:HAMP domain-containing protein
MPGVQFRLRAIQEPQPHRLRPQDTALFRTIVESDREPESPAAAMPSAFIAPPTRPAFPKKGVGLTMLIILTFLVLMAVTGAAVLSAYFWVVPDLMRRQIHLRSESIAETFAASVIDPVLVRNFLRINQAAEKATQLPGVVYVAVLNPKDIVVAGLFGNHDRFSKQFLEGISAQGFPSDLVLKNKLGETSGDQSRINTVDGTKVLDLVVPIGDTRWEAHVGLFTSDVDEAMRRTLKPVLVILGIMALIGGGIFAALARTVSRPIRQLCDAAVLISQGHLNQKIQIDARGEIGELALALEAMRLSINQAVGRLRKRNPA